MTTSCGLWRAQAPLYVPLQYHTIPKTHLAALQCCFPSSKGTMGRFYFRYKSALGLLCTLPISNYTHCRRVWIMCRVRMKHSELWFDLAPSSCEVACDFSGRAKPSDLLHNTEHPAIQTVDDLNTCAYRTGTNAVSTLHHHGCRHCVYSVNNPFTFPNREQASNRFLHSLPCNKEDKLKG